MRGYLLRSQAIASRQIRARLIAFRTFRHDTGLQIQQRKRGKETNRELLCPLSIRHDVCCSHFILPFGKARANNKENVMSAALHVELEITDLPIQANEIEVF